MTLKLAFRLIHWVFLAFVVLLWLGQGCGGPDSFDASNKTKKKQDPEPEFDKRIVHLKLASNLTTVFDRETSVSADYYPSSPPRGFWIDGSIHPYRNSANQLILPIPHSETFMLIPGDFYNPDSWTFRSNAIFDSRKTYARLDAPGWYHHRIGRCGGGTDFEGDNRIWPFAFRKVESRYFALAHHEWYADCDTTTQSNTHPNFNHGWVNSIISMASTDGGNTFLPKAYSTNSPASEFKNRFVLRPEPYHKRELQTLYGFFHPSNLVKEKEYYYSFVDYRGHSGTEYSLTGGLVLIRTNDLSTNENWQIYSEEGWLDVNEYNYLGNDIQPFHVFFKEENWNPYTTLPKSVHLGARLLYHTTTRRFVAIGHGRDGRGNVGVTYIQSNSLSEPDFESFGVNFVAGTHTDNYLMYAGHYISAFNPESTDPNFEDFSETLTLFVTDSHRRIMTQKLVVRLEDPE